MKVNITKKVGDTTLQFQVEEPKDIDALFQAGCIASMPTHCSCGSEDVELTGNKKDGYTFVKIKCHKCQKTSQLGQYKEGGFFWKQFEEYKGKGLNAKSGDDLDFNDLPIE